MQYSGKSRKVSDFYSTISDDSKVYQKFNPLLNKVRQDNINCVGQLGKIKDLQKFGLEQNAGVIGAADAFVKKNQNIRIKRNSLNLSFTHTGDTTNPQGENKPIFSHQQSPPKKNHKLHDPSASTNSHFEESNFHQKPYTADLKLRKKLETTPHNKTAENRNRKASNVPKGQMQIQNNQWEEFNELNDLKSFIKMPHFTVSKSSKIKRHLVQQIDLQEIEEKFFKQKESPSKYKAFCEGLINRNKELEQMKGAPNSKTISYSINKSLVKNYQKKADLNFVNSSAMARDGPNMLRALKNKKIKYSHLHSKSQSFKPKHQGVNFEETKHLEKCFFSTNRKFFSNNKRTLQSKQNVLVHKRTSRIDSFQNEIEGKKLLF